MASMGNDRSDTACDMTRSPTSIAHGARRYDVRMLGHRRSTAVAVAVLVLALGRSTAAQDLQRGVVIDDVKCVGDANESYALYLPSTYSSDRVWNLLIAFHPAARGRAMVEKYRAAAEQYGYIVAGSNTSRNGPWSVSASAVRAMSADLGQRFAI